MTTGSILRDVRTAARALAKTPAFSGVVILTLAVAIGANATIHSVVDGVLLRPLPYPEPDHLVKVSIGARPEVSDCNDPPFSDRGYWHFVKNNRAFERFGGRTLTAILVMCWDHFILRDFAVRFPLFGSR